MMSILVSRGLASTTAGLVTSVYLLVSVAGCLLVPPFAVRCGDQRILSVTLALTSGIFLLCMLFAPLSTVWVWAVLDGIVQGGLLALSLTIIVLRSPNARVAAHLSGMVQAVGYVLAATGPLIVGLLLDISGGFSASGVLFAALAIGTAVTGWGAGRARYVNARTV